MNIIVVNPKKDFTPKQIAALEAQGSLTFLETQAAFEENRALLSSGEDKVLALGPEVIDYAFPNTLIDTLENVKTVCIPTTGFSWLDGDYLKQKNIVLSNVPHYSTEAVSEFAISLMLNIARKLPLLMKNNWKVDFDQHAGFDLRSRTVGILGLGEIGTRIAELAKGFGMNVVYWSRSSRNKAFAYQEFDDVVAKSDFLFLSMAKNNETKSLLSNEKIDSMKQDAHIVSIMGDELFDFKYAAARVAEGKLAGIALDNDELTMSDYPGNIFITPHVAWFTKEAMAEDMRIWTESIVAAAKEKPINTVN